MTASPENLIDPFFAEAFQVDAPGLIARLRAEDPVHYIPEIDAWMILRYKDVRQLFTDPNVTNDPRVYQNYVPKPPGSAMRWIADNGLFSAPPEQHARMRRLVAAAFTPRAVHRMESQVRKVVEEFAAPMRGRKGTVDVMNEYTELIPNTVISRITGVPPLGDDEVRFRRLARDVISGINPLLDEEGRKRAESGIVELCDYVRSLAQQRRQKPEDDLVSDLVLAHDAEDAMTNDEIVLMIAALVAAGSETTAMGGRLAIRTLLSHPEQTEILRADRSLLPNAVDEFLRFDFGPVGLPRYAINDFELGGKAIEKGQLLMLNFMGAHRDPEVFPEPDRFDVMRDTRDLTIFGHGPHYCLGANLARQEMRCIIDAALDFLPPKAHILEDQVERIRMGMFTRPENLPVDFGS